MIETRVPRMNPSITLRQYRRFRRHLPYEFAYSHQRRGERLFSGIRDDYREYVKSQIRFWLGQFDRGY